MREILYFQAGNYANHVGTHFWNTQESYFTYAEDAEEPIVNHDISFREGLSEHGEPTFCPRLLVFDRKANIGSLSDLYGESEVQDSKEMLSQWNSGVVEYRQEPVPKSDYHVRLDTEGEGNTNGSASHTETETVTRADDSKVRFWTDYNRVFFHPRTIQRLPDLADWESSEGDWAKGLDEFNRLEEDTDIMEETFRPFVEECDNLQGLHVINDTATFGSFTHSFLTRYRDDFVKLPSLSFPILSGVNPRDVDVDDSPSVMKALNDALCLRSSSNLSSMTIPVQNPSSWSQGRWLHGLTVNLGDVFHTSAILSTHIESATLPMRLRSSAGFSDMASLCSILNWRENTRFASLSGSFPLPISLSLGFERDVYSRVYDFSATAETLQKTAPSSSPFARVDVTRGFLKASVISYNEWADQFQPPPSIVNAPACPIPTSFPRIFEPADPPTKAAGAFSSLTTSSSSSALFAAYATFAEDCLHRHTDVVAKLGLERDEVWELKEELRTLEDTYKSEERQDVDMN